jgi:hypothetical protein
LHNKLIRYSYEWQVNNLKFGSWAKKLREELDKIGLGYIWQYPQDNSVSRTCKIIKESCREQQNLFANIREKRS